MIYIIALCACQVLHIVDFLGSRRMETAPTSIEVFLRSTQSQSDEPSDLRYALSPTTRYRASVYGTRQSQAVTNPIMNRARRCLTSVIEPTPMRQRRIPMCPCNHYFDQQLRNLSSASEMYCESTRCFTYLSITAITYIWGGGGLILRVHTSDAHLKSRHFIQMILSNSPIVSTLQATLDRKIKTSFVWWVVSGWM